MTEQESKDLGILKCEVSKEKEFLYLILRSIDRASAQELISMGYHVTKGEAMQLAFQYSQKKIQKLDSDFFKKYPD